MNTTARPPQLFRLPDCRGPLAAMWRAALRPLVERAVGLRGLQQLYEGACGDERGGGFWGDTRKSWSRGDAKAQAKKADAAWKKISGEAAPQPKRARPKGGAGGDAPPRRGRR